MLAEGGVTKWAKSTELKITEFLDEYLINFPQEKVRKSTEKLLYSLFRKGTTQQRENMLQLILQRANRLSLMGRASKEFLALVKQICENYVGEYVQQKKAIVLSVLEQMKIIFQKVVNNSEYNFYALCSNMIDFGGEFKPYLLEANGCLKCFGKPQVDFESMGINSAKEELIVHLDYAQFVLKRRYEIRNMKIAYGKKKVNFKTLVIAYRNELGEKVEIGKYTPNDTIPPFSMTTFAIILHFEFPKSKKPNVSCGICSNNNQCSHVCSGCLEKCLEIEGSFKVVGGDENKISKQLCDSYKSLTSLKQQLREFWICIQERSRVTLLRNKIVSELNTIYLYIIQNLRLLRNVSDKELANLNSKYHLCGTDCYSCHFFEFDAGIGFIGDLLKNDSFNFKPTEIVAIFEDFKQYGKHNKLQSLNDSINQILSQLILQLNTMDYRSQLSIDTNNHEEMTELLTKLILLAKGYSRNPNQTRKRPIKKLTQQQQNALIVNLTNYVNDPNIACHFDIYNRILLFVALNLIAEEIELLDRIQLPFECLGDINRVSATVFNRFRTLINFNMDNVLQLETRNSVKLFLRLIPIENVPQSNLLIQDAEYLKYIVTVLPKITPEYISQNIVFAPNPILKLNAFKILPEMVKILSLEDAMALVIELVKFKEVWNLNVKETISNFDKLLDSVDKNKKLLLSLQGYDLSKENLYFQHIYRILTPQRPNFIIKLEIPEVEMQKEEKLRGSSVQYVYIPVREVKSEDLKGDTIGALREWVTDEMVKMNQFMPFDLIVEKSFIDNQDLSLEIVYRKIVQKECKKNIGNKTYDYFRVIYRIQGVFGQALQRIAGNPRDQKLEDCINDSSYLLTRFGNKKRCGLDVLMQMLPTLRRNAVNRKHVEMMFRILQIIFKNESIIKKIIQWDYGDSIISLTVQFLSLGNADIKTTEMLLALCSKVIDQANNEMIHLRKKSVYYSRRQSVGGELRMEDETLESQRIVKFVLEKVKQAEEKDMRHLSKKIIKILPFCSKDDYSTSKYLFEFFEVKKYLEIKFSQKIKWLLEFVQSLSQSYTSFKQICQEEGITADIVSRVINHIKVVGTQTANSDTIEDIQLSLTLLKGLIQGNIDLQDSLFEQGIIQEIYKMGSVSSDLSQEVRRQLGKIPLVCFQISKYFKQGKTLSQPVSEYFKKNEADKKAQIMLLKKKRKDELKQQKKNVLESLKDKLTMNDITETVTCSSCKEGYMKRKQVLGVYLFSSKIEILSLDCWWKDNKRIGSITSTSYFTPIHFECHVEALKDDQKIQKPEWEGALIRNCDVLCNNLVAFKGPKTTDEEFDRVSKKYFEKNNKVGGFWIALNDLNGLLERFSKEYNFALETKGSSYSHNAKLIIVLMGFTAHFLKNSQDIKFLREGCEYLEEFPTKKPHLFNLQLCITIFLCKQSTFARKKGLFWKTIENFQFASFKEQRPSLIYFCLVKEIIKLTNSQIQEDKNVVQYLDGYIANNFLELVTAFEKLAETYKNDFLKWDNVLDFKKFLQVV